MIIQVLDHPKELEQSMLTLAWVFPFFILFIIMTYMILIDLKIKFKRLGKRLTYLQFIKLKLIKLVN